jgi:hypothetical protein
MKRNLARTESSQENLNHRLLLSWTNQKIIFAGAEIVGLPLTLKKQDVSPTIVRLILKPMLSRVDAARLIEERPLARVRMPRTKAFSLA